MNPVHVKTSVIYVSFESGESQEAFTPVSTYTEIITGPVLELRGLQSATYAEKFPAVYYWCRISDTQTCRSSCQYLPASLLSQTPLSWCPTQSTARWETWWLYTGSMWWGPGCRPQRHRAALRSSPAAPRLLQLRAESRTVCGVSDWRTRPSAGPASGLLLRTARWEDAHTPPPTAGGARPAAGCRSGPSSRSRAPVSRPPGRRAPGMQRGCWSAASPQRYRRTGALTATIVTVAFGNLMQLTPCCTHNPYRLHDVNTHDCCLQGPLEMQKSWDKSTSTSQGGCVSVFGFFCCCFIIVNWYIYL